MIPAGPGRNGGAGLLGSGFGVRVKQERLPLGYADVGARRGTRWDAFLAERTFVSSLDSSFEAMSGFTTTGATLLSDIEAETPPILFWRNMTQWLGGSGLWFSSERLPPRSGSARRVSWEPRSRGLPRRASRHAWPTPPRRS
jgi:hypothetical protein